MKATILPLLALASIVLAAPVPAPEPVADPGYSTYGSYKGVDGEKEKRGYADYGDYAEPKGGVSLMGFGKGNEGRGC